jgi:hypothetical protein
MRLFEVDQGSARDVLAVMQGLADKEGQSSELPFPVVMNILRPFGLGISTPDGLIALKNAVDPQGDVFDVSDDGKGTIILNTKLKDNDPEQGGQDGKAAGPSVDAMASSNSKQLSPNI